MRLSSHHAHATCAVPQTGQLVAGMSEAAMPWQARAQSSLPGARPSSSACSRGSAAGHATSRADRQKRWDNDST